MWMCKRRIRIRKERDMKKTFTRSMSTEGQEEERDWEGEGMPTHPNPTDGGKEQEPVSPASLDKTTVVPRRNTLVFAGSSRDANAVSAENEESSSFGGNDVTMGEEEGSAIIREPEDVVRTVQIPGDMLMLSGSGSRSESCSSQVGPGGYRVEEDGVRFEITREHLVLLRHTGITPRKMVTAMLLILYPKDDLWWSKAIKLRSSTNKKFKVPNLLVDFLQAIITKERPRWLKPEKSLPEEFRFWTKLCNKMMIKEMIGQAINGRRQLAKENLGISSRKKRFRSTKDEE